MEVESPDEEVDGEEEILFEPKGYQQGPEISLHAMKPPHPRPLDC